MDHPNRKKARKWFIALSPVLIAYAVSGVIVIGVAEWGPHFGFQSLSDQSALGRYILQIVLVPAAAASLVTSLRTLLAVTARSELHLQFPNRETHFRVAPRKSPLRVQLVTWESVEIPFLLTNAGEVTSPLYTVEIRLPPDFGRVVETGGNDPRMPQLSWEPVVGRRSDCWHVGMVMGVPVLRFYSNGIVASFQHDEMLLGILTLRGIPLPYGVHRLGFSVLDASGRHVRDGTLQLEIASST
jgi:hypothetical protein